MNYANKRLNFKIKYAVLASLAGLSFLFLQSTVQAAAPVPGNNLPTIGDFTQGNNVHVTVASYDGVVHFLRANNSTVRIYTKNPSGSVQIIHGCHQSGSNGDAGVDDNDGPATTTFRLYGLDPRNSVTNYANTPFEGRTPQIGPSVTSETAGCTSYSMPWTLAAGLESIQSGPFINYYAMEFEAIHSGGGGWNAFNLSLTPGVGRLSYYAGSGDRFALKAEGGSSPARGDFHLGFSPSCNLARGDRPTGARIRWFDADAGQSNQGPGDVVTELVEYRYNSGNGLYDIESGRWDYTLRAGASNTGNDVSGSFDISNRVQGYRKYEWIWRDINTSNGIQFELPYDSMNTFINYENDCVGTGPPPPPNAACVSLNYSRTPSNVPRGTPITITVTVRNTGGTIWNNSHELRQTSPGGATPNVTGTVALGATETFSFTVVRNTATTVDFRYGMFSGPGSGTAFGPQPLPPPCQARVTWVVCPAGGCPVLGGDLEIDCRDARVSGVRSTRQEAYVFRTNASTESALLASPLRPDRTPPSAPGNLRVQSLSFSSITLEWNASTDNVAVASYRITRNGAQIGTTSASVTNFTDGSIAPPGTYTYRVAAIDTSGNRGVSSNGVEIRFRVVQNVPTRLIFRTPGQPDISYDFPGGVPNAGPPRSYTGPPSTMDPFSIGTFPHLEYSVELQALVDQSDDPYTTLDSDYLEKCMRVTACLPVSQPDVEPGQQTDVSFGMRLQNDTRDGFGNYAVQVNSSPGIVINSGSPIGGTMNPGDNNFQGPFRATINYRGNFSADLLFNGANINAIMNGIDVGLPCSSNNITPKTRPYLRVLEGDIHTGGAFRKGVLACQQSDLVAGNYNSRDKYAGGIRTFGIPAPSSGGPQGSRVDFAAIALGLIDGSTDGPLGFRSSAINNGFYNKLDFANYNVEPLGGLLGGSSPFAAAHCIPDYFNSTRKVASAVFSPVTRFNLNPGVASGQYFLEPAGGAPYVDIGAIGPNMVGNGKSITIYVKGSVFITKNIRYQSWTIDAAANHAPYLTIIAEGDIHIDPGVSSIEGLFIAQPNSGGNGGNFSTCSPGGDDPADSGEIVQFCRDKFTVYGSVIAKHVLPLRHDNRADGTLWRDGGGSDTSEIFSFTPSMLLGIPNLKDPDAGTVLPNSLEGLFRLPPIF